MDAQAGLRLCWANMKSSRKFYTSAQIYRKSMASERTRSQVFERARVVFERALGPQCCIS